MMIPINYPSDTSELKKEYISIFKIDKKTRLRVERYFSRNKFSGMNIDLDEILTGDFETLLRINSDVSRARLNSIDISWIKKTFNYDSKETKSYQSTIARFFFKNRDKLNLRTCYFCNIDYINGFNDISDYHNSLDFVKRAPESELIKIEGITKNRAEKIIQQRSLINSISELRILEKVKINLEEMKLRKNHSHFTLDHVLDKATYPLFALSLYNFVPSCYSCNCKFKKNEDILNGTTLSSLSPTSSSFNIDSLSKFRVLFYNKKSSHTVKKESDLVIDYSSSCPNIENYFSIFKLIGRYGFHKKEIIHLIDQKKKYSDSKIAEMARQLKVSPLEIKKDIFGRELFEGNIEDKSLTKFKRDIAKNIGIKNVK